MQLKLSILTCTILSTSLMAEDYVSVQYMGYDEGRSAAGVSLVKRFENRDELTGGVNISRETDYYDAIYYNVGVKYKF